MHFQESGEKKKKKEDFVPFVSHMYKCVQFTALERNFPASRSAYIAWNVKILLFSLLYIIFDNKDCTVT